MTSSVCVTRTLAGYRVRGLGERYVWNFEMVIRGGRHSEPHNVRHWRAHFAEKAIAILFPPDEYGHAAARAVKTMCTQNCKVVRVMRRSK